MISGCGSTRFVAVTDAGIQTSTRTDNLCEAGACTSHRKTVTSGAASPLAAASSTSAGSASGGDITDALGNTVHMNPDRSLLAGSLASTTA